MRAGFQVLPLLFLPCFAGNVIPQTDFVRDVHPVLARHCLSCHGGDKRSGGLSLSTYEDVLRGGRSGGAIAPGNARTSLLVSRVNGSGKPVMPLGAPPLTEEELAVIQRWIDEGARLTPTSAAAKARWEPPLELR
ncbi:MAG: hypothetical protein NTY38_25285, partial [Acidobacteria bacterium]|nr:hypothetical protein [Acidobacteriota bacterium]